MKTLETPNLLLEPTQPDWVDQIITIEKNNREFIGQSTKEKHLQFINSESETHYSLLRKSDRVLIGYVILFNSNSPNKSLLLKRIAITEQGKGYGRESLKAIKRLCFEEMKFHRLWLDVYPHNPRAIHLYETEGFQREGVMRECVLLNGVYRNLILLSLLKQEYFDNK